MPAVAPPPPKPSDHHVVEFDAYVDAQIRQTRRTVKAVDLSYALLRLALVAIVFFLAAAIVEHWFLERGFDLRGRLALFACLAVYVIYALWSAIWPLITRSINPIFAAQAIERGGTFKNTLVNLLQLRGQKTDLPPAVLAQLEQQAAEKLTAMPEATMIDRTRVVRIGYVLVAALAAAAIYAALSPKDLLTTARRVLAPWADIPPPSRVQITNLMPGSVELMQGDPLAVSAEVRGLAAGEDVEVTVVADDNELARNTYPLTPVSADSRKYELKLFGPGGVANPLGVQHSMRYLLEAGDGRSRWQRVNVTAAPAIAVRKVTYEYPAYTGYPKREVEHAGDIRGLEGTKVTIEAEANSEIDSAQIDLNSDGKPDLNMTGAGRVATASFVLALSDDRLTPRHASYQLRLTTADGRSNNQPARHKIEVIADLAPEVELLAPEEATREVQLDEVIEFQAEARDPDFGLTSVRLLGETAGQEKKIERDFLAKNHTGKFRGQLEFTPRDLGLTPGDTLDYWAEALDGKTPVGNRGESGRKSLVVVDKSGQQAEGRGQQKNPQGAKGQNKSPNGDKQQGEEQNQNGGGESGGANDSKPGEQNQSEENGEQGEQGQQQNGGEQQDGEQQNNGEENSGDQGPGGIQGAGKPGAAKRSEQQQKGAGGQAGESSPEMGGEESEDSAQQSGGKSSSDAGNDSQSGAQKQPNSPAKGGQQRGGESNEQSSDVESQPVARDGSDDGSALERMMKKLGQSEQNKSQESNGKQQQSGEKSSNSEQSKTPPDAATPRDGQQSADSKGLPNKEPTQKSPGDQGDGQGDSQSNNVERPDGRGESMTRKSQKPSTDKTGEGEQGEAQQGQSNDSEPRPGGAKGSGSQANPQGAPFNEKPPKPKEQSSNTQDNGKRQDDGEPPSGLDQNKEQRENSQNSESSGDQSGGGQEGGGQDAPQRGTGSAGQNESADSGDGQSSETGAGDATNRPGDAQQSTSKTGQPGEQRGDGSQQQEGQGDKPGGETQSEQGAPQPGQSSAEQSSAGQPDAQAKGNEQAPNANPQAAGDNPSPPNDKPTPQDGEQNANQKAGDNQQGKGEESDDALERPTPSGAGATENPGGGAASGAPAVDGDGQGGSPGGDAANVEFAKEQLNLVLEKLNDQLAKKEVDRELLDELGWNEEDLRKFVDRWRERQQAANQNATDESARTELDDALRSLGLKPPKIRQQTVAEEDKLRDLNQGIRTGVPLRFRDRLRAYNQGVSRSSGQ